MLIAPTQEELSEVLWGLAQWMQGFDEEELPGADEAGMDVRLQVMEDGWQVHHGDASYDQDHRGVWASSWLAYDIDADRCRDIAETMLDEYEEAAVDYLAAL